MNTPINLSKYSILKIKENRENNSDKKSLENRKGRDIFDLECIKTIDGALLRETITPTSKYIKINHTYLKINPKYTMQLFNNIKKALTYKLNNVTDLSYNSPLQTLQDHYIYMISNAIFKDPTITEPFKNLTNLNRAIEDEIDNMIYKFLDTDTYENDKTSLQTIVELLNKPNFILKFQCEIKAPQSLKKYNIKDTIWNIHVLVD